MTIFELRPKLMQSNRMIANWNWLDATWILFEWICDAALSEKPCQCLWPMDWMVECLPSQTVSFFSKIVFKFIFYLRIVNFGRRWYPTTIPWGEWRHFHATKWHWFFEHSEGNSATFPMARTKISSKILCGPSIGIFGCWIAAIQFRFDRPFAQLCPSIHRFNAQFVHCKCPGTLWTCKNCNKIYSLLIKK